MSTTAPALTRSELSKPFLALTTAYFLASLGHFSHNAEFICEYPNLPAWLTPAKVYASWAVVTLVGLVGLMLLRKQRLISGLVWIAMYAALGFDGLGHYAVAPMEFHTLAANVSILTEVAVAAALLPFTLFLLFSQIRHTA